VLTHPRAVLSRAQIIKMCLQNAFTPVIVFSFSRRECEARALGYSGLAGLRALACASCAQLLTTCALPLFFCVVTQGVRQGYLQARLHHRGGERNSADRVRCAPALLRCTPSRIAALRCSDAHARCACASADGAMAVLSEADRQLTPVRSTHALGRR
jgi:hypothetical protein